MAVSIYDSDIFSKAFTTPETRLIFSDSEYIRCIVQTEVALARAQECAGLLPPGTATEIQTNLNAAEIDVEELAKRDLSRRPDCALFDLLAKLHYLCANLLVRRLTSRLRS